jgi:ATP synthase protein I
MSQDSLMPGVHRTDVRSRAERSSSQTGPRRGIDPAAREGKRVYNALSASSVGLELGLSVAIGLLVGYYMDQWLGTEPWLLLAWMVLGLAAGFRGVFRAIARADRAAAEEAREDAKATEGGHG